MAGGLLSRCCRALRPRCPLMGHVEEKTMVPGELAPSRFVHTCLIVPFAMARPTLCTPEQSKSQKVKRRCLL
jgi:hypothetical protein